MSEFQREERYVVIKLKNFKVGKPEEYRAAHIRHLKQSAGPALTEAVVVESDWPIYEETWENIERLVNGLPSLKAQLAALREENERLQMAKLEPVLYQYRMRPTWENDSKFGAWDDCSEASYLQYQAQRIYGDWEYQSRALYAAEPDLDALKARAAELEGKSVEVTPSGIMFGDAWYSHEDITGFVSERLNNGNCSLTARQYMKWVQNHLKEPANEG